MGAEKGSPAQNIGLGSIRLTGRYSLSYYLEDFLAPSLISSLSYYLLFSSVCIPYWVPVLVVEWIVLQELFFSCLLTTTLLFLTPMFAFPLTKSSSVSCNWLNSFLLCCFFLRLETIIIKLTELFQITKAFRQQLGGGTERRKRCLGRIEVILSDSSNVSDTSPKDIIFATQSGLYFWGRHHCNYNKSCNQNHTTRKSTYRVLTWRHRAVTINRYKRGSVHGY